MPENPTIEEVIKKLENLIKVSETCNMPVIASLWVSEAKVIIKALKR